MCLDEICLKKTIRLTDFCLLFYLVLEVTKPQEEVRGENMSNACTYKPKNLLFSNNNKEVLGSETFQKLDIRRYPNASEQLSSG